MQTRTYGDLFKLIQSLAGVTAFATNEQDDIANLINRNYQVAYDTIQMWPRYLVQSEERNVNAFTLSGINYNSSDLGFNTGYKNIGNDSNGYAVYYPSKQGTVSEFLFYYNLTTNKWEFIFLTVNSTSINSEGVVSFTGAATSAILIQADSEVRGSPTDVEQWTPRSEVGGFPLINSTNNILYDEDYFYSTNSSGKASKPLISEFIRIHKTKAFLNNSALEYDFFATEEGGNILNIATTDPISAFVTYKKKFVPFTTSSDYTTSTEEVPAEFFQFIAYAAYSDFLRMDGQHEKAQLEQENAQNYLSLELERVDVIMNQNTVNKRFSTHLNRQSR
tara:strand:- start:450 stop:1451 length:1002 start_codon:yes stop_codon:yes gene_type:complete